MSHVLPFREFVLKVHSRCDLACDHCYVYEHADQSWRGRPKAITEATALRAAERIAEHAVAHRLPGVHVILHGGEPLLLGLERTHAILKLLRERIDPVTELDLRIHTNGLRFDANFCALFAEFGVRVGVSLDGDRSSNDRHRRFANGQTSHPQVLHALELLRRPEFAHLYAGLLCTIDVANDPVVVYEALAAERPPRVDLLLPHATWDNPPVRSDASRTQYADWLGAVYDRWMADGRPFPIRTFDSILAALRGDPSQTESLGLTPTDLLVIETDGAIEQADSLKTAFAGAAATGLNIVDHTLDRAAEHEGIKARQQGLAGLCKTCRECAVVDVCGGGLYAHRFRSGTGFANPSVYCADLKAVIVHVRKGTTTAEEPTHTLSSAEFDTLASGYGAREAVNRLAEGQDSIRRNLISTLIAATHADDSVVVAGELLVELDSSAPQAVGTVLRHPHTRHWAAGCLAALQGGEAQAVGLSYLNALAAAAAALAGAEAELTVPVVAGAVRLPTIGFFSTSSQTDAVVSIDRYGIKITCGNDRLRLEFGDPTRNPAWKPVRRLTARGVDVSLDDTDACWSHQQPVTSRLSAAEVKAWQVRFADAVEMIASSMPDYLPGLQAGLTGLLPLNVRGHNPCLTEFEAFGTVSAVLPNDPADLALQLVSAFQRNKLGGILDLFQLFSRSVVAMSQQTLGRAERMPLEKLWKDTYADIAVTDFWRAARDAPAADTAMLAKIRFARWRSKTADAVEQLHESSDLTTLGRRFVDGMTQAVVSWFEDPQERNAGAAARRSSIHCQVAVETHMGASP